MDDYQQKPLPDVPVSIGFYVATSIIALAALGQRARIGCQRPNGATRPAFGLAADFIVAELASILLVLNLPKIICYTGFRYGMRGSKGVELACQTQSESFGGVPLPSVFISLPLILILSFNEVRLCSRHTLAHLLRDTLASMASWSGHALNSASEAAAGRDGSRGAGSESVSAVAAAAAGGASGSSGPSGVSRNVLRVLSLPVYRGTYVAPVLQALRELPGVDSVQMHAADAFSTVLQPESDAWLATNVRLEGESASVIVTRTDFVTVPLPDASVDLVFIPATRALPLGRAAGRDASDQLKAAELAVLLAECLRVLKPGGAIAATVFAQFSIASWEAALASAGFTGVLTEAKWVWLSFVPSRLSVALKPGGRPVAPAAPASGRSAAAAAPLSGVPIAAPSSSMVAADGLSGKARSQAPGALAVRLLEEAHADASEALRSVTMEPPPSVAEARRTLASSRHSRSLDLPPARGWFPSGRLWRIRDALLAVAALTFAGVVAATVVYFDALARVPGFVGWSWTAGALALNIVQQVPVALYFMAVDLSHFVGQTIDSAASEARAAAAAAAAGKRLSAARSTASSLGAPDSERAALLRDAGGGGRNFVATADIEPVRPHAAAAGSAAASNELLLGREASPSRPVSLADSRAAALSTRIAARANLAAATASDGDAKSTRAVLRRFTSEMWTALLGLSVFQLVTWAPGFVLNCTLLKMGASQSAANTATLISTIIVFSLIIPVGRRLYAWHKARRERELRAAEAEADRAAAAAAAEVAEADIEDGGPEAAIDDPSTLRSAVAVAFPSPLPPTVVVPEPSNTPSARP